MIRIQNYLQKANKEIRASNSTGVFLCEMEKNVFLNKSKFSVNIDVTNI